MVTDGAKAFIKNKKLNKYLFVLRDKNPNIPSSNCWGLLGGGIKPGETPLEALKREIEDEETSIKLYDIKKINSKIFNITLKNKIYKVTGYVFLAYTDALIDEIRLQKGQKAKYFTIDEIKKQPNLAEGALSTIENYEKFLT